MSGASASFSRASSRAHVATRAPSSTRVRTTSRPIPLLPPVTMMTRSRSPRSIAHLVHPEAAVDHEGVAGDERRVVRKKEQDGTEDVVELLRPGDRPVSRIEGVALRRDALR